MTTVPLMRPGAARGAAGSTRGTGVLATPGAPRTPGDPGPVVLLVEDNLADVELTCMALDEEGGPGTVFVARDGVDALAFLRHEGAHADAPRPDLVLLDLNLPGIDGRGVLAEMKRDAALKRIPVVVLTSSSAPDDVAGAYDAGCNCFVTKPVDLDAYLATVRAIEHFWHTVARRVV